jgi:hypothetical protein
MRMLRESERDINSHDTSTATTRNKKGKNKNKP